MECRSASSRYSRDTFEPLGRQISVFAKKIPARAAPTAPRPTDHTPIPNSPSSSPDQKADTAENQAKNKQRCLPAVSLPPRSAPSNTYQTMMKAPLLRANWTALVFMINSVASNWNKPKWNYCGLFFFSLTVQIKNDTVCNLLKTKVFKYLKITRSQLYRNKMSFICINKNNKIKN